MRRRRGSIATAWWALALFACTAAGPAVPGFALCVGTDGHVTVEGTHGTAPCATHLEQHHGSSLPPATAVDTVPDHGCVDTVLNPPRGERPRHVVVSVTTASFVVDVMPARASDPSHGVMRRRDDAARDRGADPRVLSSVKLLV